MDQLGHIKQRNKQKIFNDNTQNTIKKVFGAFVSDLSEKRCNAFQFGSFFTIKIII
jgi:hypothetical protein